MLRICTVRDKMKNILKNYFLFIKIYEKYFYQKSKKKIKQAVVRLRKFYSLMIFLCEGNVWNVMKVEVGFYYII